ncbi:uncharacterized protein TNCV_995401 [Trichonephila clavipes]|nr:uncharacterized protein TNCV_995401 [Trichonephila clavipes]
MGLGSASPSTTLPNLSCFDFNLIPKMFEPLRGIRFKTVPEILAAVDQSIQIINRTGAATDFYDFHIVGNGLYTMPVTILKDCKIW